MIDRIERVQEMIKREVAVILQEEINDPKIKGLTVTRVEVSRDLKLAKIFYMDSAGDIEKEQVKRGLDRARGFIRSELAERVSMKFIPEISFREDSSGKKKETMDTIFDKIRKERREDNG